MLSNMTLQLFFCCCLPSELYSPRLPFFIVISASSSCPFPLFPDLENAVKVWCYLDDSKLTFSSFLLQAFLAWAYSSHSNCNEMCKGQKRWEITLRCFRSWLLYKGKRIEKAISVSWYLQHEILMITRKVVSYSNLYGQINFKRS